jgi:polyferredoxin
LVHVITLYFIRAWLRWFGGFLLALLAERVFLGWSWLFILIGLITLLLFGVVTVLLYGDWRATRQSGIYRYDFIRDISRK